MRLPTALMLALLLLVVTGCGESQHARQQAIARTVGDPERGERLIRQYHCGACHTIPGVRGAAGAVGPPLSFFSRRIYIAGEVPNTPRNLVRWVKQPQSIEPTTAMPSLGLSEREARDIAAYLYTLD